MLARFSELKLVSENSIFSLLESVGTIMSTVKEQRIEVSVLMKRNPVR